MKYRAPGRSGQRDRVLVATKVRMPIGRGPNDAGLSRHHVFSGCEPSLRLADNLAAASLTLTQAERSDLDQTSALPLIYPYWHQAGTARDRLSPADLTLLGPHLS